MSTRLLGTHAVTEALRAGRPIERVIVLKETRGSRIEPLIEECRERKIPVRFESREALNRFAAGGTHQGVIALVAEKGYATLESLLEREDGGLLVVLDGVEDPHNLGAIIRSAHAAGALAVVIPERHSAGLTETVARASAGAVEHLAVARVKNLTRALEQIKERGYWVYGLDERGERHYDEVDYAGKAALVLGAEGAGLRRLTAEHCDALVKIPVAGKIASLNVSVAAGIVLFEALRQRRTKAKE